MNIQTINTENKFSMNIRYLFMIMTLIFFGICSISQAAETSGDKNYGKLGDGVEELGQVAEVQGEANTNFPPATENEPEVGAEQKKTLFSEIFDPKPFGSEEDKNGLLKIAGYSGLAYDALGEAMDNEIEGLTDIKILSTKTIPCYSGQTPTNTDIYNVSCHGIVFASNFSKLTIPLGVNDLFNCGMAVFTHYSERRVVLGNCGNTKYKIIFSSELNSALPPTTKIFQFEELDILPTPVDTREVIK